MEETKKNKCSKTNQKENTQNTIDQLKILTKKQNQIVLSYYDQLYKTYFNIGSVASKKHRIEVD